MLEGPHLYVLGIGLVVLALDLLTKYVVQTNMALYESIPVWPGVFHITYVLNPGAAFGILQNQRWLFVLISLAAVGAILYYSRHPLAKRGLTPLSLGLVLGGAIGNMIDRVFRGKVVDMFEARFIRFPVFNVADIAIVCGVGLMILLILQDSKGAPADQQTEPQVSERNGQAE